MANSFAHIELNTDDPAGAKQFYKQVFDWKFTDMPDGSYTMIDTGGGKQGSGGGIQKKPMPEAPTAWLPYVRVNDVKGTIAKAAKSGARVVVDFMSLGGMGALGIFIDPTGATLGVWEAGKPQKVAAKKAKKVPAKKTSPAKKKKKKK